MSNEEKREAQLKIQSGEWSYVDPTTGKMQKMGAKSRFLAGDTDALDEQVAQHGQAEILMQGAPEWAKLKMLEALKSQSATGGGQFDLTDRAAEILVPLVKTKSAGNMVDYFNKNVNTGKDNHFNSPPTGS